MYNNKIKVNTYLVKEYFSLYISETKMAAHLQFDKLKRPSFKY